MVECDVNAAVTNLGDLKRLRRLFSDLDAGRAITIAAAGSSVTSDFGGQIAEMQRNTAARLGGGQRRFAENCGQCTKHGWLLDVFHWINSTWPHAGHRIVNNGNPASTIQTYHACLGSKVEPQADLVVVEPISTGGPRPRDLQRVNDWRATFEMTLRGFMLLPRSPAVVLLNVFNWCVHDPDLCNRANLTATNTSGGVTPWTYHTLVPAYHLSFDADARDVGEYYQLPVVSSRGLFFHSAASGRVRPTELTKDRTGVHPTPKSSRCLSDALVHLLKLARHASSLKRSPPAPPPPTRARLPPASAATDAAADDDVDALDVLRLPPPAWLSYAPRWAIASAYASPASPARLRVSQFCFNWEADKVLLPLPSVGHGWHVEAEYHGKPKPGLRASAAGADALIGLPVGEPSAASPRADSGSSSTSSSVNGTLDVRYLSTFHKDEVGAALLGCEPPCVCEPVRVDGYSASFEASVDLVARVPFSSPRWRCDLRVRALPAAESAGGGTGFKLTGVDLTLVSSS